MHVCIIRLDPDQSRAVTEDKRMTLTLTQVFVLLCVMFVSNNQTLPDISFNVKFKFIYKVYFK